MIARTGLFHVEPKGLSAWERLVRSLRVMGDIMAQSA